jgi:8-oxo-dGTP diphosphatase
MKRATLSFLIRRGETDSVLLGLKKRGFGRGKWNGFGGKLEPGETAREAAAREIAEECGLVVYPEDLTPAGRVTFFFPSQPAFDHDVALFAATAWQGEVCETEEMKPAWFPVHDLPLSAMWRDDAHWLPHVLAGSQVEAEFAFADDGETIQRSSLRVRAATPCPGS